MEKAMLQCGKCGKDFERSTYEEDSPNEILKKDPSDDAADDVFFYCSACEEEIKRDRAPVWQSIILYAALLFCAAVAAVIAFKPPRFLISLLGWFESNLDVKILCLLVLVSFFFVLKKILKR